MSGLKVGKKKKANRDKGMSLSLSLPFLEAFAGLRRIYPALLFVDIDLGPWAEVPMLLTSAFPNGWRLVLLVLRMARSTLTMVRHTRGTWDKLHRCR